MGFDFKGAIEKMSDTRYARVRHILVEEKGDAGRAKLEEAKEEIAGDLDKFSEFAEKMSTCTSAVSSTPPPVAAGVECYQQTICLRLLLLLFRFILDWCRYLCSPNIYLS